MRKFILGLMLMSLMPAHSVAQPTLAGTYRLLSLVTEIDGEPPRSALGATPRGYVILTPTRWINVFTSETRKFGTSVEDKAALWDSLVTYSGTYRVEGNRLITAVDVSWNERWNGTEQVRYWQQEGNRLSITTERAPWSRDPSKMAVSRAVLERVE